MPQLLPYRPTATHKSQHDREPQPIAIRNALTGQRYELGHARRELVVGCADQCDIVVTDPFASASHCSLKRVGKRWIVKDHNSKNGTRVNGARIQLADLKGGSHIAIGDTRLEILTDHGKSLGSNLVGKAPNFLLAVEKTLRAARTQCSVLILGETGTGKELIARTIHDASRRSPHPFVAVNCGAIPPNLVSSELFGHARGAFTGAAEQHDGLFTQAHRGTIFLDELGELPMEQQPLLLRTLESGLIRRVGGTHEELVNARFVSATNRNCLNKRLSPLRSDLFHRLSTIIIELPPLRERSSDIPLLVTHFLREGINEYGPRSITPSTLSLLQKHEWMGNIRELRNSISRALALGGQNLRITDFLPAGIVPNKRPRQPSPCLVEPEGLSLFQQNQRELIAGAYERHGTIRRAAAELGMPKSTFADMCKRYGINTRRIKRF